MERTGQWSFTPPTRVVAAFHTALAEGGARVAREFEASRPHYLIDTIADLPGVIDDINAWLARGEMPQAC